MNLFENLQKLKEYNDRDDGIFTPGSEDDILKNQSLNKPLISDEEIKNYKIRENAKHYIVGYRKNRSEVNYVMLNNKKMNFSTKASDATKMNLQYAKGILRRNKNSEYAWVICNIKTGYYDWDYFHNIT